VHPSKTPLKTSTGACTSWFLSYFTAILYAQGPFALETVYASMSILLETISHPAQSLTSGAKHVANALKVTAGKSAHSTLPLKARGTMSGTSTALGLVSTVILPSALMLASPF
jgi:hypothetical protein